MILLVLLMVGIRSGEKSYDSVGTVDGRYS